jgi:hypothetical protein
VVPSSDRLTDDLSINRPAKPMLVNGEIDTACSDSMRDQHATVDETAACLTDRSDIDASKEEESQSANSSPASDTLRHEQSTRRSCVPNRRKTQTDDRPNERGGKQRTC